MYFQKSLIFLKIFPPKISHYIAIWYIEMGEFESTDALPQKYYDTSSYIAMYYDCKSVKFSCKTGQL